MESFTKRPITTSVTKTFKSVRHKTIIKTPKQNQYNSSVNASNHLHIALLITTIAFAIRYINIEQPNSVVFDELHYIKFITLYLKRVFFFDTQPPFGKQLLTIISYLSGFKGDLSYSNIGDSYNQSTPIKALRFFPCIVGSFIPALSYLIAIQLRLRKLSALLIAVLLTFENIYITQSKFILLESVILLFISISLLFVLKFVEHSRSPISMNKLLWLFGSIFCSSLAIATKYSSLYSYSFIAILVAYHWTSYLKIEKSIIKLAFSALIYTSIVVILPIIIYTLIYHAHLSWLSKAGPHDSIMTSAFQASLENGLASITQGQPLEIVHGSQITLRHTHGRSCWLHSHEHLYPIKYPETKRGSSHQQQVTCYSFKDINNWWIVKRPHVDDIIVGEQHHDKIIDGDIIQLIHGLTGRALNSHDVASSMSPHSQEVSCYVDHNISMPAQDHWKVKLLNPADTNNHWHTLHSLVQFIHLNSSLALRLSGRQLPDWGFNQHEIVADKETKSEDAVWNVEEHRFTKTDIKEDMERDLSKAEFIPLQATALSFKDKFLEIHYKLFSYKQDTISDHLYASESPLDWILMEKGTAFWVANDVDGKTRQIFLLGNIVNFNLGLFSLMSILSFSMYLLIRRRRKIYDINEQHQKQFEFSSFVIIGGYLVNVVPYFLYESPIFLQSYTTAILFKSLAIGSILNELMYMDIFSKYLAKLIFLLVSIASLACFYYWLPLIYGFPLNLNEIEKLRWKESWQLLTL